MDLSVGQVVKGPYPINAHALSQLSLAAEQIANHTEITGLDVSSIRDSRIAIEDWPAIFYKEVLNLYLWSLKRVICNQQTTELKQLETAYCFQPYYGIALHYLRRVLPLVLLDGIKVSAIFSDDAYEQARLIIQPLHQWLGLEPISILSKSEFTHHSPDEKSLLIVTGKTSTFQYLKKHYDKSCCIGATGQQALLVLEKYSDKTNLTWPSINPSCTHIGQTIHIEGNQLFELNGAPLPTHFIHDLNPTVIYSPSELPAEFNTTPYKCINLAQNPSDSGLGLCADPLHGYPGDYLY